MQPKTDITIYRTKGDTDPVILDLRVNRDGTTTKVVSSANVALNIKFNTMTTIYGTSSTNGIFSFDMTSVNTANLDVAKFEVHVTDTVSYVIGTGSIYFKDRLS